MPAFDLAQFCSSQTSLLAFSAEVPAGKRKTPNLQIRLAKDQYKLRLTHTLPSGRRQSWPTKSYDHNGDSETTTPHQNTRLDRQWQTVTSMEGLLCIYFGWAAVPARCISAAFPSVCQQASFWGQALKSWDGMSLCCCFNKGCCRVLVCKLVFNVTECYWVMWNQKADERQWKNCIYPGIGVGGVT